MILNLLELESYSMMLIEANYNMKFSVVISSCRHILFGSLCGLACLIFSNLGTNTSCIQGRPVRVKQIRGKGKRVN